MDNENKKQENKNTNVTKESQELTRDMINEWRTQFGSIYRTDIGNKTIVWHKLNRGQYIQLMVSTGANTDMATEEDFDDRAKRIFERQENICRAATIWPENIDDIINEYGALATNLADEIMARSGFGITSTKEL